MENYLFDVEMELLIRPSPHNSAAHVYNLAARMRSPDLRWTMGRMTLKCIYTFAVTFSKMEKLVKFLILH